MIHFLIFIQQLIASGTHVVAKGITGTLAPEFVLLIRAMIASFVYLIWILIRNRRLKKIDKKDLPYFVLLGLLNIPMNQFLFLKSISLTSPPNVALAYAMTPAFVLVIAMIFLKEQVTSKKIAGVLIAIIGAFIILLQTGLNIDSDGFKGDLTALVASFSWGLYTVIGKRISTKYGAIFTTGMAMFFGLALYLPMFFILDIEYSFAQITSINWVQLIYLGAITSGVGYALWYYALTKIEASKISVYNNLQPVLTTLLSVLFFATPITLPFIFGGLLIIAGVTITQRS